MYVGNMIILHCIKTPGIDKSDIDVIFFFFQNYEDTTPTVKYISLNVSCIDNRPKREAWILTRAAFWVAQKFY
jgi:hypothetical protein